MAATARGSVETLAANNGKAAIITPSPRLERVEAVQSLVNGRIAPV